VQAPLAKPAYLPVLARACPDGTGRVLTERASCSLFARRARTQGYIAWFSKSTSHSQEKYYTNQYPVRVRGKAISGAEDKSFKWNFEALAFLSCIRKAFEFDMV
jgi:hypothetical protein